MASRILVQSARAMSRVPSSLPATRSFRTSSRLLDAAPTIPARKPMGAFRGGFIGFLLGSTLAASGSYFYVLQDYKTSNALLTEDIYTLGAAVTRVSQHLGKLEDKMDELDRKKKA